MELAAWRKRSVRDRPVQIITVPHLAYDWMHGRHEPRILCLAGTIAPILHVGAV